MCGLLHSPAIPPGLSMRDCGAARSATHCTACPVCTTIRHVSGSGCVAESPVCPGCPSPPLLPVWMNVSFLSPWLSDFRVVRFSVSSGCFLFLNCCCPSFGCVRRHSVSTYASILAGRNSSYSSLPKKMTLNAVSIFPKTLTELLISLSLIHI